MLSVEFGAAVMLLTRLPVGWLVGERAPAPARCLWAYPLVGGLIGAGGAAAFVLARRVSMPPLLAAVWTMAVLALLTGALHEDGLADLADGFGGGTTREKKLTIMQDSRIGSYGVLALVLAMAIRIAALASLLRPAAALIAASALSRAAMAAPVLLLPTARAEGLGAGLAGAGLISAAVCCGLAAGVAFAALPAAAAAAAIGTAVLSALAIAGLARAQIGGYTGDVLGACAVVAEGAVLTLLVCAGQ